MGFVQTPSSPLDTGLSNHSVHLLTMLALKNIFMNVTRIIHPHEVQAVCSSVAMCSKIYQLCNVTIDIV